MLSERTETALAVNVDVNMLYMFCLNFYHRNFGVRKINHCVGEGASDLPVDVHTSQHFLTSTEKPRLMPDNSTQAGSPDVLGVIILSLRSESIGMIAYFCFVRYKIGLGTKADTEFRNDCNNRCGLLMKRIRYCSMFCHAYLFIIISIIIHEYLF